MKWNNHSRDIPEGSHAFLGASKYSWLNYDEEKVATVYRSYKATQLGTRLHALAAEHIELGLNMPETSKTFDKYVNDAIGFRMSPEVQLYYSDNCYGTTDAISFSNNDAHKSKKYFLRIHDLKTGVTPASLHQLEIYAALFFLEYKIRPEDTEIELRLYQNDDIVVGNPTVKEIKPIMNKIILFDKRIEKIKLEG